MGDEKMMPMIEISGVELMCGKFSDMRGLTIERNKMMANARLEK